MKISKQPLCRLCFKMISNKDFQDVKEITNILDVLLFKVNLHIFNEHSVCFDCLEVLKKCFDFKSTCLDTENVIIHLFNSDDKSALNLREIYMRKNQHITRDNIPKDQEICRLCVTLTGSGYYRSLFEIEEEWLQKCVPELNVYLTKNPIICDSCFDSLKTYFIFLKNCTETELKIMKCCEIEGTGDKDKVGLNQVLQFMQIEDKKIKVDVNVAELEQKLKTEENIPLETQIKIEKLANVERAEIEIKIEDYYVKTDIEENTKVEINESSVKTEVEEINLKDNQTKLQSNQTYFQSFSMSAPKPEVDTDISPNLQPQIQAEISVLPPCSKKHKKYPREHVPIRESPSAATMHHCTSCSYKTKYKKVLCKHKLAHESPSEKAMYQCASCSFKAKFKSDLARHLLTHKNPSEVAMHQCGSCSYQTKYKDGLKRHMLTHKDPSDIRMYECGFCNFQTRHKSVLQRHTLTHKKPSEIIMYQCDSCSYQAKYLNGIKRHMWTHKKLSEIRTHQCDSCSFRTKYKHNLKKHNLVMHKNLHCSYESKNKDDPKSVQQREKPADEKHKSPSEVTMYQCDTCSYQSESKKYLKSHMLWHKNPSEATLYECKSCSFQTKYKSAFNLHLLTHKDPSEITMHKCEFCLYKTRCKRNLRRHATMMHETSEITMHRCDFCSFQTKYKYGLQRHAKKCIEKHNDSKI